MSKNPISMLLIKDPLDELEQNKYYKRGSKAAKDGDAKDTNPYNLEERQWEKLRKRTYWLMGFQDFIYSGKKQELDRKLEKQERKRQKHKDKKQKSKDKKRKQRSKDRHKRHRHGE